ncbi:MAG: capsule assembly Wzi family protein [Gemmatimonadaceae bacterium]
MRSAVTIAMVCVASVCCAVPTAAVAQATPTVAPTERVTSDIMRLAAVGLIDTIVVGSRPYSRREVVRMLNEAQRNIDRLDRGRSWAAAVIRADLAIYAVPPPLLDRASAEETLFNSAVRGVPGDANGSLDATIDPLVAYREGRPLGQSFTETLETWHGVALGPMLALQLNPRLTLPTPTSPTGSRALVLQSGAANTLFGNLSIEAGRDYVVFGPEPDGGLLLSNNGPALTLARVMNDSPIVLPGWLRIAGPARAALFVADLGVGHQVFPHSRLAGYHVAIEPSRHLELGGGLIDEMGGDGAPAGTFTQRIIDLFPPIKNYQFSNKLAAFDGHLRLPEWMGFEAYVETALDDFDVRRIRSSLLEDGGWVGGVSVACIFECGRVGLRAEYRQTGIRFYTHNQFASGVESQGVILGDPLGPRGLGGYVTVDRESDGPAGTLALAAAFEVRSGNLYGSVDTLPHDANFHFVQTLHRPAEKRARALLSWTPAGARDSRVHVEAKTGLEHVDNFNWNGTTRWNALGQLSVIYRP